VWFGGGFFNWNPHFFQNFRFLHYWGRLSLICLYYVAHKISKQRRGFPWHHEFAYLSKKLPLSFPHLQEILAFFSIIFYAIPMTFFHYSFKVPLLFSSPAAAWCCAGLYRKFFDSAFIKYSNWVVLTTRSQKPLVKKEMNADTAKNPLFFRMNIFVQILELDILSFLYVNTKKKLRRNWLQ